MTDEDGMFSSGGLRLFRKVWRPRSSRRAVMVIVHGLRDHSGRYEELARELNEIGVVVHAADLRGHGKSEGRPIYTPSFEDYLRDLERFLKFVEEKERMEPAFLMGHSMGGAIVTRYAQTRSPPLKGLVLSGPALKPGKEISKWLMTATRLLGDIWPSLPVLKLNSQHFSRDPEVVQSNLTDPLIHQGSGPARTAAALLSALTQIQAQMEGVQGSLLLLHGTADQVTDPSGSEELSRRATSKDVTLKLYQGLYHDLIHEPEGAQVRGDIRKWVEARLG